MKLSEIHIRDPFIVTFEDKYYLYGAPGENAWEGQGGFLCYTSSDLKEWSSPCKCFTPPLDFWADTNFWAPEVHYYNNKFYMFASFYRKDGTRMRATQILVSDFPEGPFKVWSEEPVTPVDWMCLDGTLYIEDDTPYMVFCHEWLQTVDGEMCVVELSKDLKHAVGEPRVLFKASDSGWAIRNNGDGFVTDGPFLHKTSDGKLVMIWSSFSKDGYAEAVAYSDNGSINGNWKHCKEMLSDQNGGHGMIFKDLNGDLRFTMHFPNSPHGAERAKLFYLSEIKAEPYLSMCEE